jgi:hypothetical protein
LLPPRVATANTYSAELKSALRSKSRIGTGAVMPWMGKTRPTVLSLDRITSRSNTLASGTRLAPGRRRCSS